MMNITAPAQLQYQTTDAGSSAIAGIREQLAGLERNVAEVAQGESNGSPDSGSRDRALIEQGEIVRAVRANARSLEASNQAIGTILDIKV
jgi:hypothetical protein